MLVAGSTPLEQGGRGVPQHALTNGTVHVTSLTVPAASTAEVANFLKVDAGVPPHVPGTTRTVDAAVELTVGVGLGGACTHGQLLSISVIGMYWVCNALAAPLAGLHGLHNGNVVTRQLLQQGDVA